VDAGLIAADTGAHLHIGCTLGTVDGPITLDAHRRFDVAALYNITAYLVDRGVLHPARITGVVFGRDIWLTVSLTDTAVTLGPVHLRLDVEPGMAVCPICRPPMPPSRLPAGRGR
jgi:hypothetical protein